MSLTKEWASAKIRLVLIEKLLLLLLLFIVRIVVSERGFMRFSAIPVHIYYYLKL